jgi:hypothetical protein
MRRLASCADLPHNAPSPILRAVPAAELQSSLAQFVTFARSLKGDEKSEAQSFLDQFFRALGHASAIEAGATFEFRVAKKPGSAQLELIKGEPELKGKGGKKFADLLCARNLADTDQLFIEKSRFRSTISTCRHQHCQCLAIRNADAYPNPR